MNTQSKAYSISWERRRGFFKLPTLIGRLRLWGEGLVNSMNLEMGRRAVSSPATLALCSVRFCGRWGVELCTHHPPLHTVTRAIFLLCTLLGDERSTIPPTTYTLHLSTSSKSIETHNRSTTVRIFHTLYVTCTSHIYCNNVNVTILKIGLHSYIVGKTLGHRVQSLEIGRQCLEDWTGYHKLFQWPPSKECVRKKRDCSSAGSYKNQ